MISTREGYARRALPAWGGRRKLRAMRIVTVVGARPQFIKAAPVSAAVRQRHDEILVHTGQHWDRALSEQLFEELGLPDPDHHLGIHGGTNSEMVGRMLPAIADVLRATAPDVVLVFGDTNSTLAAALAAAQLHLPIAHVEAGLRSGDLRMPEELNRIVTDRLSSLLFCPNDAAVAQLRAEGIVRGVHAVGDVMLDALLAGVARLSTRPSVLAPLGLDEHGFVLATIHRAENADDPVRLAAILDGLGALGKPVVLPLHPRTRQAAAAAGLTFAPTLRLLDPVGQLDMLALSLAAAAIVTDSGGVQKEAYWLGIPCVTVRTTTEWGETVSAGWNQLVAADREAIVAAVRAARAQETRPEIFGPPGASERIAALLDSLS
jgi:UDP-GlcNAc3NAcA epimerase